MKRKGVKWVSQARLENRVKLPGEQVGGLLKSSVVAREAIHGL